MSGKSRDFEKKVCICNSRYSKKVSGMKNFLENIFTVQVNGLL